MKSVGFIYDDIFLKHETPKRHPENKDRLVAISKAIRAARLTKRLKISDRAPPHLKTYRLFTQTDI